MKRALLFISGALLGFAAPTALVTGTTSTQAVLQIRGAAGACTVQVSTAAGLSPLVPDVNGSEYSGAATDTGRADTITQTDGTRVVTIGHMNDDRALAAATLYYWQISGCGGTVSGTLATAPLSNGTTLTQPAPYNSARWGNFGFPAFNWVTKQSYTDPTSGATLTPMELVFQTWRTGCGASCAASQLVFTDVNGGSGWTTPGNIINGITSTAATGNTNVLSLFVDVNNVTNGPLPYDYHRLLEDVGLVVYGQGSSATAADRQVTLSLVVHATSCGSITVTLPTGSIAQVDSSTTTGDLDFAWPNTFPAAAFSSWSGLTSPCLHMEDMETSGTATVSGSTLTIASPSASTHFSSALIAGDKIFVSNSSPGCTNNLCTVASVGSPASLTVSETPSGTGSQTFRAYGWSIQAAKVNTNGTVTLGLKYKLAGTNLPIGIQAGGDRCQALSVTSGDGKVGQFCQITSAISGFNYLAFIANDGTFRLLKQLDALQQVSFDAVTAGVAYEGANNANGGRTVLKLAYGGNYTTDQNNVAYTCGPDASCPAITDGFTSTDLMPHASNADLNQQIAANQGVTLPAYNSALYGDWTQSNGNVAFYGGVGNFVEYCNLYSGQGQPTGGGPGWCAIIDLSQTPATVVRLVHTLDGTGCANCRFGSLHNTQPTSSNNTLFFSLDGLDAQNTSLLHGGPFQAVVSAVLAADGVTWNSNTCLPGLDGSGGCASTIYGTCPTNSRGFTTCVVLSLPQGGVCNNYPTTAERAAEPACPWNASFTLFPAMQVSDNAVDLAGNSGNVDNEHFMILSASIPGTATCPASHTCFWVARNSTYDYCSYTPWHGLSNPLSAESGAQTQHANGWTLTMMPGIYNSCGIGVMLQDESTGTVAELGHSFAGHFATGVNASGINFVTTGATIYNSAFASLGRVPPAFTSTAVSWGGIASGIGTQIQSYTDQSQFTSGLPGYPWAIDMNPFVACSAEGLGCGSVRNVTHITGNIYTVQPIAGNAGFNPTLINYKSEPMVAWAGRYQLKDVSGPGSSVDSTPYSVCSVVLVGECHAGSAANAIYVNVPAMYDPTYCSASINWANIPCVLMGSNAPAGGIRQFDTAATDATGTGSRYLSSAWARVGSHYPFTHATVLPSGKAVMIMGTNPVDGHDVVGFTIALPPLVDSSAVRNQFGGVNVQIPPGPAFADVEFGYSRIIGPGGNPSSFYCTGRAEACVTDASLAPYAFAQSDTHTGTSCATGCTITLPVQTPNVIYYRVRRSPNGSTWTAQDTQALAVP